MDAETYLDIKLDDRTIRSGRLEGEAIVKAGTVLDRQDADRSWGWPPSIRCRRRTRSSSRGPSRAPASPTPTGRASACKSPLTGRRQGANGGGSFSYGLGQPDIGGLHADGARRAGVRHALKKDGTKRLSTMPRRNLGKGNFEAQNLCTRSTAERLTIALLRPGGEYKGLLGAPSRFRATRTAGRRGFSARGRRRQRGWWDRKGQGRSSRSRQDAVVPRAEGRSTAAIKNYSKMLLATRWCRTSTRRSAPWGHGGTSRTRFGGLPVRKLQRGQQADVSQGREVQDGRRDIRAAQPPSGPAASDSRPACPAAVIQCKQRVTRTRAARTVGLTGGVRDPRAARHELWLSDPDGSRADETPGDGPSGR